VLLIAIKDQARVPHEWKADVLDKSKPKSRPSLRRAPLLRLQLKLPFFRALQQHQFNRNQLLHQQTLRCVLLSSQSNKFPKVKLLIAINFKVSPMPKRSTKKNASTGKNQSKVNSFFQPAEAPPPVDVLADSSSIAAAAAAAEPTLEADALTYLPCCIAPLFGIDTMDRNPSILHRRRCAS